ncbi:hypothetical protein [Qipengyuania atrilutea]|uniref:Uncharacterized protein n=1 Tax=Qipengyuania atrilutea TaxID=2744473 RepID=A0A850GW75_9SPHN|nr:hypothetical protein [Actirhodobacter atriluteus]NVD43781.1 hypothetical protein [Actirhodobacter atriluteus]
MLKFAMIVLAAAGMAVDGDRTALPFPEMPDAENDAHAFEPRPQAESNSEEQHCERTIEQVRAERNLPLLRREPASPDKPYLLSAVDKTIDGCPVLVMHSDKSDVRPVPETANEPIGLIPAR